MFEFLRKTDMVSGQAASSREGDENPVLLQEKTEFTGGNGGRSSSPL
jgi:hypothetical protein